MIILYNTDYYFEIDNNNPVINREFYLIRKIISQSKLHRLKILVTTIQSSPSALGPSLMKTSTRSCHTQLATRSSRKPARTAISHQGRHRASLSALSGLV